jgi:hypothetical protein
MFEFVLTIETLKVTISLGASVTKPHLNFGKEKGELIFEKQFMYCIYRTTNGVNSMDKSAFENHS